MAPVSTSVQRPSRRRGTRLGALSAALLMLLPAACGGEGAAVAGQAPGTAAPDADVAAQDTAATQAPPAALRTGAPLRVGPEGFGHYLAGRHAQASSDTAAAADFYSAALAADPTNVTLARRAYFFLLADGREAEALRLAERTLELDPESTVAPLVLAAGATAQEDFAEAAAILGEVDQRGLNAFMVPLMRAWALAGTGDTDAALAVLAPMAQRPQLKQMHDFHAGLINDLAGRAEAAWTAYQATLEGDAPLSLRSVEVVANFLLRQGRGAEAAALVGRYREEHPDSLLIDAVFRDFDPSGPAGPRPVNSARAGMAEALYGAASSVMQTSALDTSLVFARMALMQQPDFPYAWLMIGDILLNQERFADAAEVYRSIPADSPIYYPVRLRLAEALANLERQDEALALLRDLAKDYPRAAEAPVARGDLLRRQEKWDAAAAAYREGITRLGELEPRHWTLLYSLGVALERGGRWDEAEQAFLDALDLQPDQPLVLNYLGYSWIDRGENLEKGKALIETAVRQRPTDGYIVDSLGWAHYLLGDYEQAVKDLERAVELTPADPTINDHLGDAYWRVGRTLEARFQWQRALSLDPEEEMVEAIRDKLANGLMPRQPVGQD